MRVTLATTLLLSSAGAMFGLPDNGKNGHKNLFDTVDNYGSGTDIFGYTGANPVFKNMVDNMARNSIADETEKFAEAL